MFDTVRVVDPFCGFCIVLVDTLTPTSSGMTTTLTSTREIINDDAFHWMNQYSNQHEIDQNCMFPGDTFTSIPDISELPGRFGTKCRQNFEQNSKLQQYQEWFIQTTMKILSLTPKCAIFLQSDIRYINPKLNTVEEYIDKSFLLSTAAKQSNFILLWHKICYNVDKLDQKVIYLRPGYSHLMCFIRQDQLVELNYQSTSWGTPDIFPRGEMIWNRAIGINAGIVGISFLKYVCHSTCVVDPFCGCGTVLAIANVCGLNSIGCELSNKRCRKARLLDLKDHLQNLGYRHLRAYGLVEGIPGGSGRSLEISDQGIQQDHLMDTSMKNIFHEENENILHLEHCHNLDDGEESDYEEEVEQDEESGEGNKSISG